MIKFKKALNTIATILTVIMVIFAIILVLPRFFNLKPFNISGTLVYANQDFSAENIVAGDEIIFIIDNDTISISKVIEVKTAANTLLVSHSQTNTVYFENYIGKAVVTIPIMGHIVKFINTNEGKIITGIGVLFLIGLIVMTTTKPEEND